MTAAKPLPLSREELQRRRDNNLCHVCGKPGHYGRDCPVKKSHGDRKGSSQRHLQAKGSKGSKGSKPSKGGKSGKGGKGGKAKGLSRGKKGGPGHIRELDAQEYGEDETWSDYEDYDPEYYDYYDDYAPEEEESVTPEGASRHPSVA